MIFVRYINICDQCTHVWMADDIPERCAKCKSRNWNDKGVVNGKMRKRRRGVPKTSARQEEPVQAVRQLEGAHGSPAVEPEIIAPTDETPDEAERDRRKQNKAERHRQLKADAQAAVEAEGVPKKFIVRMNTPSENHHLNCPCLRCQIKRGAMKS